MMELIGYSYDQIAGYATRWNESNSSEPTYVSSDNEYASYSMSSMPTEPVVAATFNKELVEREGELFGEDGLLGPMPTPLQHLVLTFTVHLTAPEIMNIIQKMPCLPTCWDRLSAKAENPKVL